MFVVLERRAKSETPKPTLLSILKPSQPQISTVETDFGSYISVKLKNGRIFAKKLQKLLGYRRLPVVVSAGVEIARQDGLNIFDPSDFLERVFVNTVCRIIERVPLPLYQKSVIVADLNAGYTWVAKKLIRYAVAVTVVTHRPQAYKRASQEIFEEFGAHLIVSGAMPETTKVLFAVCPDREDIECISTGLPVFAPFEYASSELAAMGGVGELNLPANLSSIVPPGVSPEQFFGALWADGRSPGLEGLAARTLRFGGRMISISEAIGYILKDR